LREAASAVSPPDQAYGGDDGNRKFGSRFRHFGLFSSLTALMIKIYLNNRQDLVPIRIVDQHFNSRRLLAALARAAVKMRASVIAQTGGGGGF
jgi:hypothetical protein